MSLYYTPNVHRTHPPQSDSANDLPGDGQPNFGPQRPPFPAREDGLRQRQRETSLNDDTGTGSIFVFPQPPNSTSPVPSNSYSSPRSPYSENSVISQPAHRGACAETSRSSHVSQSESSVDIDGISTPTTTITLSIGSAFTDIGDDEGSVEEGRIEAVLWDWDDGADEGIVDGPDGESRRSQRDIRPNEISTVGFARGSQVRPWPLQHGSGERLRALIEREQLRNRWRDRSHFQHTNQSRSRSYSPLSTPSSNGELNLLSLAPHPKIRIPFLDFFAYMLGVEESTVDLLTRCPTVETHGSALLPGYTTQPLPSPKSNPTAVDGDDDPSSTAVPVDENSIRGFHKALLSSGVERDSWVSLKEGLAVFYDTASVPTQNPGRLLGLAQLWGLVSHVYVRGGSVIRSVYSSTRASPSRVGEAE
jgi:hypothetical protein